MKIFCTSLGNEAGMMSTLISSNRSDIIFEVTEF